MTTEKEESSSSIKSDSEKAVVPHSLIYGGLSFTEITYTITLT